MTIAITDSNFNDLQSCLDRWCKTGVILPPRIVLTSHNFLCFFPKTLWNFSVCYIFCITHANRYESILRWYNYCVYFW